MTQQQDTSSFLSRMKVFFKRWIETGPKVETEFLPGALEVSETPPSPIGRAIGWVIISFVLGAFLWATLSKVEVVAVASGKTSPSGQVKVISATEVGVVREIHVRDGQRVKNDDPLITLDPTVSEADELRLSQQLLRAKCDLYLANALFEYKPSSGPIVDIDLPEEVSLTLYELYQSRFRQEVAVLRDSLASKASDFKRLEAQAQRINQTAKKYREVLSIDKDLTKTLLDLYKKNISSRFQWLQSEQQRIRNEQDLAATLEQVEENEASREGLRRQINLTIGQFKNDALVRKTESENEISSAEQELAKAKRRSQLRTLTAPVSGKVQQLAIHTVGGVVETAKPLLILVPEGTPLEVNVKILNKDIGFVKNGQQVALKLEAFPFTEYGLLPGEIEHVSADAVPDSEGNLLFDCKIRLLKSYINVAGENIELTPGMNVTAEIVLRERRLISYFLSPLIKYSQESLRER